MKKSLLLFLFSLFLCACSTVSTDPDVESGFVVGSISFTAQDAATLRMVREVYLSVKKESNAIFNAFDVRLEKEGEALRQTMRFSFPLQPNSYKIGQLRLYTAGNELLADTELPISFDVTQGNITYIGSLELQIESQEGLLTKVINRQVEVANSMGQQEQDMQHHNDKYTGFTSLPVLSAPMMPEPKKVHFITKDSASLQLSPLHVSASLEVR